MRKLLVALATLCLVGLSVPGFAAEGWQRVGRAAISSAGIGRIVVVAPNAFGSIRLEASQPAELSNIRVEFADGTSFAAPAPLNLSATERSREIDLPGAAKPLRSVVFTVRAPGGGANPQGQTIVLYGGQGQ